MVLYLFATGIPIIREHTRTHTNPHIPTSVVVNISALMGRITLNPRIRRLWSLNRVLLLICGNKLHSPKVSHIKSFICFSFTEERAHITLKMHCRWVEYHRSFGLLASYPLPTMVLYQLVQSGCGCLLAAAQNKTIYFSLIMKSHLTQHIMYFLVSNRPLSTAL